LPPVQSQAAAKTLVFCSEASPETLDTMILTSGPSANVARALYNSLGKI
jgi:hypothetical protein